MSALPDARSEASLERLAQRIHTKEAVVGVVGLGYVGLPVLVAVQKAGYPAVGLDSDPARVEMLKDGRSYLRDVTDSEVGMLEAGNGSISAEPDVLERAEVIVICVPTPLTDHAPDLTFVRGAAETVGRSMSPGRLVILESTTYPGTTEEELLPLLEKHSGLTGGRDFALAFSPERINPGQDEYAVEDIPKVVGGVTKNCRDLAVSFYRGFVGRVVAVAGTREAEMAKLLENTFRHINIALVNEMAILAHELDVDIWESIRAASTKPFGFMPFWPGPGVGGHCIPIDPSYLSWRVSQRLGQQNGFIEHANSINRQMPKYVVERISELLNESGKALKGSRLLALGVAYKPGVADVRESRSVEVLDHLSRRGAEVAYHDAFVAQLTVGSQELTSRPLSAETLAKQDCVVILTAHPGIDWDWVVSASRLVFDSRGVTAGIERRNLKRL